MNDSYISYMKNKQVFFPSFLIDNMITWPMIDIPMLREVSKLRDHRIDYGSLPKTQFSDLSYFLPQKHHHFS